MKLTSKNLIVSTMEKVAVWLYAKDEENEEGPTSPGEDLIEIYCEPEPKEA